MAKHSFNLDSLVNETFHVTFKGETIKVKKPPEEFVYHLYERIKQMKEAGFDVDSGLELTADTCSRLLSNNEEGKEYSVEWVKQNLPLDARTALMMAYMDFITDINRNPN